jgi:hypothetical protein
MAPRELILILLIGNCFLDAPRFRENCFCAGFIGGNFAPSRTRGKHRLGGCCQFAPVCRMSAARRKEPGENRAAGDPASRCYDAFFAFFNSRSRSHAKITGVTIKM